MVRVISQKFSPPRSRHSSGETDRDLAERTKLALSSLGGKKIDALEHNESSSDSFWDSEFDGEHAEAHFSETTEESQDINGNDSSEKSDLQSKRRERRRERNKLSAQAYRKRRRNQSAKDQEQMSFLESKNRHLHKLVEKLEKDREQGKQFLRGCNVPMPDFLIAKGSPRSKKELNPVPEEPSVEEVSTASYHNSSDLHPPVTNQNCFPVKELNLQQSLPNLPVPAPPSHTNKPQLGHICPSNANISFSQPNSSETNVNVSQLNLYPSAHILTPEPISKPSQGRQILVQAHTLIPASITPQQEGSSNFSTCHAIPAYFAVPVENPPHYYANANLNLNFSCHSVATSPESNVNKNDDNLNEFKAADTNIGKATFDAGSTNASVDSGNKQSLCAAPADNPVAKKTETNTLVGLVQVGMCNSDLGTHNLNLTTRTDDNGNRNGCDNHNTNNVGAKTASFQNYNLNLNQKPTVSGSFNNQLDGVLSQNTNFDMKPNELLHFVLAKKPSMSN